ncbi:MAG: alkaline phosphatase D family protein [Bryobacteraceae bacterium]
MTPLLLLLAQTVTHGPSAGDVTPDRAVIWVRGDRAGEIRVRGKKVRLEASADFTGKVELRSLRPNTRYDYTAGDAAGSFRTAPDPRDPHPVTFAWGGDVAGQNVCRDTSEGVPIFRALHALAPDFFIGLGDMIYGDNTCEAVGRYKNSQIPGGFPAASDLAGYWAHWKYNLADDGLRTFLRRTPYYAIWDDHEVADNFDSSHKLMPAGHAAFLHYNPIVSRELYRSFRWGRHVELFFLDTRHYRVPGRTLLGARQLAWFQSRLARSRATWKVIVSSVPMSIPTGPTAARDSWVGYEDELQSLLRFAESKKILNQIWLTTDVHFAAAFRYPRFRVHEFITGPLNAGLFPTRNLSTTLAPERLFFFGPEKGDRGLSWEQAKPWMNFGVIRIDGAGNLTATVRDVDGKVRYELTLPPG